MKHLHLLPFRWTLTITCLAILAISGCGNKNSESPSASPSAPTAGEKSPQSASTASSAPQTATSPSSTKGTLTDQAQKLGKTPQGTSCPKDAPIKGKITAKRGNIYHTTKSPDYKTVKPDICFKDTQTAQKAGFTALK